MIVLGIICGLLVVVLFLRERDHAERTAILLTGVMAVNDAERQTLLDRIERPGTVVAPLSLVEPDAPPVDEVELLRLEHEGVV